MRRNGPFHGLNAFMHGSVRDDGAHIGVMVRHGGATA